MNIYQFDKADAQRFADEQHIKTRRSHGGKELEFEVCPYCRSTKDKYKFSINMSTGAFVCLRASCNARGNMLTLHKDFNFDLGIDVKEYERPRNTWKRFPLPEEKPTKNEVIDYLHGKRGIEPEIISKYRITTKKDSPNIITFPFIGETGQVDFIKYRKIDFDPKKDSSKEWSEKNMLPILFGMSQCNPENSTLIITEGQIDSLSVASCGYENAVSVPTGAKGFTWIPHCWTWLQQFKTIIVFGDHEHGEITLLDEIRTRFRWCQIKSVRPEAYKDCKDANELLLKYGKTAIKEAIETAEAEMPERVRRIEDVADFDEKTEKLPTGIKSVDYILNGGIPFGAFNILTGKRGEGKSTEASMLVKQALANDYTVFMYSGELPCRTQKRWLDLQIAGRDHVQRIENDDKTVNYTISKGNREIITNYYRQRVYLYDTGIVSDEEKDLIPTVEKCIVQFGCRVILIDNLMTAIDLFNEKGEKLEIQEKICKKLARMAMEYNVLILLIAHKRKGQGYNVSDDNDEVLGSSEITNLADVVMSYERPNKKDIEKGEYSEDQRLMKVTKNRTGNGKIDFKGVVLDYDEASKRIYALNDTGAAERPEKCFIESEEFTDVTENPFD